MPKYKVGDKVMFDLTSIWYNNNAGRVFTVESIPEPGRSPYYVVVDGSEPFSNCGMSELEEFLIPAVMLS